MEAENMEWPRVLAVHTDEVIWYPNGGEVIWFKDAMGTVWCKFGAMEEEGITCIPQLYITRVELEC
jgi:hypothetical protein